MTQPSAHSEPTSEVLGAGLGVSGRIAQFFLEHRITPLLALLAVGLGLFAVLVTPKEEEPQINVTMANVLIPFPGSSAREVEQAVAGPAEQVLSQISGVEHVMSVSRPGLAVITVQYKVGVPRTEALVRLYDTLQSNRDWLPAGFGVAEPIVKPKGIDDVPIVALTLYAKNGQQGAFELERVAHAMEAEIKRVAGTREVTTLGGPGRAVNILIDPARMNASGVTLAELRTALQGASLGLPAGQIDQADHAITIDAGGFLVNAAEVARLIIAVHGGKPVSLADVATVRDGPPQASRYVWYGKVGSGGGEYPAVTISVTKKPGENAVDVAERVLQRAEQLHDTVIPDEVGVAVTRDYGITANDKANKLIHKLMFATASVVALVFLSLGRREAAIVGLAVVLTLTATLFASWAWGFTINRVSLFALIFSIGILVDDAIVVVENIHRHMLLEPGRTLASIIPKAVDEVGGPTILATLTVIAALLPMAFVSGLMGPYMSPIPINASMGMLLSLAIAFIVTPWLSRLWLKPGQHGGGLSDRLLPWVTRIFTPFLDPVRGARQRLKLWLGVGGLIAMSVALPVAGLVVLKMLPFDNKSEFQVVVDMPAGTPVERTAAVLSDMARYLATVPEVTDYQAYAGLSSPINFNGLVRGYYLRSGGEVGDIQVNLLDKHHRADHSHAIALRVRPALEKIAVAAGARVKVVEVPPGPPVLAPIVAEIYGPDQAGRSKVVDSVQEVFAHSSGIVDVDSSNIVRSPREVLVVDRRKAALAGVPAAAIVSALHAAMAGEDSAYLHDASKYPTPLRLRLPASRQGSLDAALQVDVRGADGRLVPIRELVTVQRETIEQPLYHKDLLPVGYVVGDMAGGADSPLYGMFGMRNALSKLSTPGGGKLTENFFQPPKDGFRGFSLKWDGEWQITYETFRDMGIAYAVGLVLIYLLVVAQFGSYLTPLIIMAPIPLTIIGVMPGHALLGSQFTATSMIGMIALAGIIVRNSILLVDFINLQCAQGVAFRDAVIRSAATRAQPIVLTALAAMLGAFFILDDPIFNGLAISLIFGVLVSTLLTLVVIPLLYYTAYCRRFR